MHLYPDADVPVIQVSLPLDTDEAKAFALGQALAPLARAGALIIGSGSLTHNLYEFRPGEAQAASDAQAFSAWVRQAVLDGGIRHGVLAMESSVFGQALRIEAQGPAPA
jgi:4,5-DOPA dioxygenase extradiol